MKKLQTYHGICILIVFVMAALSVTGMSGCSSKEPSINVDGKIYKFGEVKEGTPVVFTFFFTNTGKKDLVINELNVSCSCVKVKEYTTIVKPGDRGKVYGFMTTKGFQGPMVKAIQLKTNIPGTEPVVLTLEGTITPGS